jgi:transposase
MLAFSSTDKVFLGVGKIDFRKQITGLIKSTQEVIRQNPYSRCYFAFTNRKKTSIKLLHYDGTGFWMHQKVLSQGKFRWPSSSDESITMSPMELQVLLMQGDPALVGFKPEWTKVA